MAKGDPKHKLYRVEIATEVLVLLPSDLSEKDVERRCEGILEDVMRNGDLDPWNMDHSVYEERTRCLPGGWDIGCLVYGPDKEVKVEEAWELAGIPAPKGRGRKK